MGGWHRPAGPVEAARRASARSHAPPISLCFALNQSIHPLLVPGRHERGGAGRPKWGRPARSSAKNFRNFFVKFSDAKLSNFKHGLVEIQNMIMQVEKKFMQGKI